VASISAFAPLSLGRAPSPSSGPWRMDPPRARPGGATSGPLCPQNAVTRSAIGSTLWSVYRAIPVTNGAFVSRRPPSAVVARCAGEPLPIADCRSRTARAVGQLVMAAEGAIRRAQWSSRIGAAGRGNQSGRVNLRTRTDSDVNKPFCIVFRGFLARVRGGGGRHLTR
jgi:hypothetical protein